MKGPGEYFCRDCHHIVGNDIVHRISGGALFDDAFVHTALKWIGNAYVPVQHVVLHRKAVKA